VAAGRNVTLATPVIGSLFIVPFPRSTILPGNDNYRSYLNAGIIAMNMDGFVKGAGPGHGAAIDRHARGIRR
jgi:hypothetical protein